MLGADQSNAIWSVVLSLSQKIEHKAKLLLNGKIKIKHFCQSSNGDSNGGRACAWNIYGPNKAENME